MKSKLVLTAAALVLIVGGAVAQNDSNQTMNQTENQTPQGDESLNTVILATNSNYPDALMASSASEKLGLPVLLTEPDNLSDSTSEFIEERDVNEVIIVGGDAVVSNDVQSEVESITDETVRLWSENASGTSIQVSEYFWKEGYDSATVVQTSAYEDLDTGYAVTSAAANTAETEPLLISREGNISEDVLNELENRGVQEVELYTEDASASQTQLENLGIDVTVNEGSPEDIQTQVYNEIRGTETNKTLVTVAGEEFEHGLPAYAVPTPTTYVVNADNTESYTEFINDTDFSRTMVIGDEQLSNTLVEEARAMDITAAPFNQGTTVETSVNLAQNTLDTWTDLQNERYVPWQNLDSEMNETENETENVTENNVTDNETGNVTDGNITENVTENETGNETNGNVTEDMNQTENQTENETADNATQAVNVTDLNITAEGDNIVAEVSYNVSGESVSEVKNVTQQDDQVMFVFNLDTEEEEFETDNMVRNYDMRNNIEVEEDQEYQVTARVNVDNQTVEETEEFVTPTSGL